MAHSRFFFYMPYTAHTFVTLGAILSIVSIVYNTPLAVVTHNTPSYVVLLRSWMCSSPVSVIYIQYLL